VLAPPNRSHTATVLRPLVSHLRWNAQKDGEGRWTYEGWQRSVAQLEDAMRLHGPFDGLMGFSQVGGRGETGAGRVVQSCSAVRLTAPAVPRLQYLALAGCRCLWLPCRCR
jgi:hypothetical protein